MDMTEMMSEFSKLMSRKRGKFETRKKSILLNFEELKKDSKKLASALMEDPEDTLKAMEMVLDNDKNKTEYKYVRITNLPKKITPDELNTSLQGEFLIIIGRITDISGIEPYIISAKFECPSCGNHMSIMQFDNIRRGPKRCACGRRGSFTVIHEEYTDSQRIKLANAEEMNMRDLILLDDLADKDNLNFFRIKKEFLFSCIVKFRPNMTPSGRARHGFKYDLIVNNFESSKTISKF